MKFIVATLLMIICFFGIALIRKDYFSNDGMGASFVFYVIQTVIAGGFIDLIKTLSRVKY